MISHPVQAGEVYILRNGMEALIVRVDPEDFYPVTAFVAEVINEQPIRTATDLYSANGCWSANGETPSSFDMMYRKIL